MRVKLIIGLAAATVGIFALFIALQEDEMPVIDLRASQEMAEYEPFSEDVNAIQDAWGAPIPNGLQLVGGPDEIGYAFMRLTINETTAEFEGVLLNRSIRYSGPFRYEHPQSAPLPDLRVGDYVMSHIENDRLVVGQENSVPRDWFYLVPERPETIERR